MSETLPDNADILKLVLDAQAAKKNTIVVNPMTTLLVMMGVVAILFQFILGFGMWTIQEHLKRYDGYEIRIAEIEKTMVRFEKIPTTIEDLIQEIKALSHAVSKDYNGFEHRITSCEASINKK